MDEYIEKERLISVIESNIKNAHEFDENDERFWRKVLFEVIDIPPSDVRENVPAHWRINADGYYPYCSHCRQEPPGREMTDFCPNCGADMREVQ